jgi:hypothetical protein
VYIEGDIACRQCRECLPYIGADRLVGTVDRWSNDAQQPPIRSNHQEPVYRVATHQPAGMAERHVRLDGQGGALIIWPAEWAVETGATSRRHGARELLPGARTGGVS